MGIAINAQRGATVGTWEYFRTFGANWINLPALCTTNALLLPANAKLRFVPNKNFSGTVSLTAYASGIRSPTTSPILAKTGTGRTTPFNATALAAMCLVNSAPTLS